MWSDELDALVCDGFDELCDVTTRSDDGKWPTRRDAFELGWYLNSMMKMDLCPACKQKLIEARNEMWDRGWM